MKASGPWWAVVGHGESWWVVVSRGGPWWAVWWAVVTRNERGGSDTYCESVSSTPCCMLNRKIIKHKHYAPAGYRHKVLAKQAFRVRLWIVW